MARVKHNVITKGISGNFGKQIVFKQYGKSTVVSSYPDMTNVIPSEKQTNEKLKFRMAMAFAKRELKNPAVKEAYKKKAKGMQRAHNVAVSDYYNPPIIGDVKIETNHGDPLIKIVAWDDFQVVSVEVEWFDGEGVLIETGLAEEKQSNFWECVTKEKSAFELGTKLIVKAKDRPGNVTVKEISKNEIR